MLYNGYLINIYVQSDIQSARLQLSKNNAWFMNKQIETNLKLSY